MAAKIEDLLDLISQDAVLLQSLSEARSGKKHLNVSGLCQEMKGYVISGISHIAGLRPVVIVPDAARARVISSQLAAFTKGEVITLMPSELSLVTAEASSKELGIDQAFALTKLLRNEYGAAVICAPVLINRFQDKKIFKDAIRDIAIGDEVSRDGLIEHLTLTGYRRTDQVTRQGEFACRGDIVDVFVPGSSEPYRINFFGDEIDLIKSFDIDSQRATARLEDISIPPAAMYFIKDEGRAIRSAGLILAKADEDISRMRTDKRESAKAAEILRRTAASDAEDIKNRKIPSGLARWLGILPSFDGTVFDYIDTKKSIFFVDEMIETDSRLNSYAAEYAQRCKDSFLIGNAPTCAPSAMLNLANALKALDSLADCHTISCLNAAGNGLPGGITCSVMGVPSDSFAGKAEDLAELIKKDNRQASSFSGKKGLYLLAKEGKKLDGLRKRLAESDCYAEFIDSALPRGFNYPRLGITVLGEGELFGSSRSVKPKAKGNRITFFGDIKPGDYVVHDTYGIGRYDGMITMSVGDTRKDYLKLSYANEQVLYILPENLDSLQKYVGPAGREPKLTKLGGDEWKRSVTRARESIKKVAFDLLKLYASRSVNKGFACAPDDENQAVFEERFPYVETEDQLRAIKEIKADMESEKPMDRLLCGDVGFGKTEVAFRAVFKAVMNGRQAILLAPTTLLAQQHYANFMERCKGLPVNVVLMSRFTPANQIKQNVADIKSGKADVIIGTHRVLSADVKPPHLGLLVVDEEQRFGVNHKEKIKSYKNMVDVLSLSATPIPRTLHMSLSGIRDISILEEAPFNRRAVQTYVMGYDEQIIVQAIMREIARDGQIFYLYNKTSDIDKVAARLEQLMPGVRVCYAHGQMGERALEGIVEDFIGHKYDIMVCTTIIENGVDMPNVNTLIVENADRFGLAQLYQIKGRVGRSDRQAYAYITYNADIPLNEDAKKRLVALREFTELGSGVRVAMRDLEVRGAGSLLGAEQHGQMDVIGYELYCRLLDEEVKHLKQTGELAEDGLDLTNTDEAKEGFIVEVDYDAYIPASYIPDEASRMSFYRRIGAINSFDGYNDFMDEAIDRYGDPPSEVYILADISLLRALGKPLGFTKASIRNTGVRLYLDPNLQLDMKALGALMQDKFYGARCQISATGLPFMAYKPTSVSQAKTAEEIVGLLKVLHDNKSE
ncbi:MAG: transcription-repair coupling factor [Saccharofermentans sp.]|nr:transcription-repair coupling factor [Saccharofermentans sp.]